MAEFQTELLARLTLLEQKQGILFVSKARKKFVIANSLLPVLRHDTFFVFFCLITQGLRVSPFRKSRARRKTPASRVLLEPIME